VRLILLGAASYLRSYYNIFSHHAHFCLKPPVAKIVVSRYFTHSNFPPSLFLYGCITVYLTRVPVRVMKLLVKSAISWAKCLALQNFFKSFA